MEKFNPKELRYMRALARIGRRVGVLPLVPIVLCLIYLPYLALLFGASVIVGSIIGFGFNEPISQDYFQTAWKVYVGFIGFELLINVTYRYQNCCVGLQHFRDHLRHTGASKWAENIIGALIWPVDWYLWDRFMKSLLGQYLADIFLQVGRYWLVDSWKGTILESLNFSTGESSTTRVKP